MHFACAHRKQKGAFERADLDTRIGKTLQTQKPLEYLLDELKYVLVPKHHLKFKNFSTFSSSSSSRVVTRHKNGYSSTTTTIKKSNNRAIDDPGKIQTVQCRKQPMSQPLVMRYHPTPESPNLRMSTREKTRQSHLRRY